VSGLLAELTAPSASTMRSDDRWRSTLLWQLTVEATTAPTSRLGPCTSMVDGAWNAHMVGIELAFEAVAANIWSPIPARWPAARGA